ncbi:hypothetical protein SDRG_00637 [Saprolegnia diclina VS20]|uniref:Uncharacterized protein n=1 Tax=Saprolegnia diclina (strain VS20) TaxID=1156394 RepID=T0QU84_SAPDV|nr:hypothetical protein SDRG_00637 [Saprolegnia diclina VS20]EQC41774.1 hypothetical protein SDRG_00637 [Saprolegnia diclina VS20]|eukprot:XP_008604343.1 hypothetical protein SDRG_00637 [Saprolegnia diclina VS20]
MDEKEAAGSDVEAKTTDSKRRASDSDDDDRAPDAPSADVVALRDGYNQTYIIQSSKSHLHEVLFRCGNWCYTGKVDVGDAEIALADLPVVIPALQKQQGSLQFLCEWKQIPATSPYAMPLETLYDAFDFIGTELASKAIEKKLMKAAQDNTWVDDDADAKNFFELETGGFDCFDGIDLVASKTFVRGLVLVVIYYQRSFYVVLQEGVGEQPLLDVRFPDLTQHLQGVHLRHYQENFMNMKKLVLWQAMPSDSKPKSPPKTFQMQCKDVSGTGYNQTFLIQRTQPLEGHPESKLREVLFRFGSWCYNGHVDLGPKLELSDIPVVIPMLRRQQSALTFMCEVTKMPATSLFASTMEYIASIVPAIQAELAATEEILAGLQKKGDSNDVSRWLNDEAAECFFELGIEPTPQLKHVEAIACKVYTGTLVMIVLYYDNAFYVHIEDGEDEQPLLDTRFPDVTCQKNGFQVKTLRNGVKGFPELRKISLWKVKYGDGDGDEDRVPETMNLIAQKKVLHGQVAALDLGADAKTTERRKEEDVKGGSPTNRKINMPHHIAPLKTSTNLKSKLKDLGPVESLKAPWDETGRPVLGSRK